MVHHDAVKTLAHRLPQQRREHRGIDAPGQRQQHVAPRRLLADMRDGAAGNGGGRPFAAQPANPVRETLDHALAVARVGDFRMELHAEQAARKQGVIRNHPNLGGSEFGAAGPFNAAAKLLGDGLHAVADAQNRLAEIENALRGLRRALASHRLRPSGEHDAVRREFTHRVVADVPRQDFGINPRLADAAGDQLRRLRSEIKDQDSPLGHARPR